MMPNFEDDSDDRLSDTDTSPIEIVIECFEPPKKPLIPLNQIAFETIVAIHTLNIKLLLTENYQFALCFGKQEADDYADFICYQVPPKTYAYMAYIFYSNSGNNNELILLKKTVCEQLKTITLEGFNQEYNALFEAAVRESGCLSHDQAFYRFLGCEYLLMTYAKLRFSSAVERERFIQSRAIPLYDKIIALLEKQPRPKFETPLWPQAIAGLTFYQDIRKRFERPVLEKTPPAIIHMPSASYNISSNSTTSNTNTAKYSHTAGVATNA